MASVVTCHRCGALACGADDFRLIDNAGLEHVLEGHILELDAQVVRDRLTPGEHGDVLEHRLAAVTEARRLHGCDLQTTATLVDDEGGQSFAFDVLRDDQQGLAGLNDRLEDRQQRLQR